MKAACGGAFHCKPLLFYFSPKLQPSCRGLQWHSWTDEQPHPLWHPIQHQGQRQWPLHLQVRPARIWRYAAALNVLPLSQSVWWNMSVHPLVNVQKCISLSLHCQYKVTAGLQLHIWVLHFMGWNLIHTDFLLELWHIPCSRLVVWGLRSIQPEWHILPQLLQCGSLQRHQVVLLEGSKSDGYHDDHDGAPGKLLTESRGQGARLSSRLWWTKWTISRKWYIWGGTCYPTVGGFSSSTSWSGARVDAQQRTGLGEFLSINQQYRYTSLDCISIRIVQLRGGGYGLCYRWPKHDQLLNSNRIHLLNG